MPPDAPALPARRALAPRYWAGHLLAAGSADGYVFEEIAENLAALGRQEEARPYFGRAVDELSKDDWFVKHEAARLAHLRSRAEME